MYVYIYIYIYRVFMGGNIHGMSGEVSMLHLQRWSNSSCCQLDSTH